MLNLDLHCWSAPSPYNVLETSRVLMVIQSNNDNLIQFQLKGLSDSILLGFLFSPHLQLCNKTNTSHTVSVSNQFSTKRSTSSLSTFQTRTATNYSSPQAIFGRTEEKNIKHSSTVGITQTNGTSHSTTAANGMTNRLQTVGCYCCQSCHGFYEWFANQTAMK